jgi:hypothetical protein
MFGNQKSVSRERLIGISFVDILIQAVFLLFIALTVGYQDPVVIENIKEYAEAGKDLCNKVDKSSIKECVEVLGPVAEKEREKEGSVKLTPCIKPISENSLSITARFLVVSPQTVRFEGFTDTYREYLKKNNDEFRLNKMQQIEPAEFTIGQVESRFGFIREKKCFHSIVADISLPNQYQRKELQPAFGVIGRLRRFDDVDSK